MRESRGEYLKRKWHAWQQVNSEARGEMAKMETVGVEIAVSYTHLTLPTSDLV